MNCLICNKNEAVKFLDDYKLEMKEDKDYFKNAKIYRCNDCDFAFVHPMPSNDTLDYFYKHVYRAGGRPPYLVSENYEDQIKHYLEDKNLSYLLYLTTLIDVKKIKNFYDFGCGDGDLGYALKKKFPQLNLFCSEGDSQCEKILKDRKYKNFENINEIDKKFDLIVATHSLEHLSDINSIFSKFKEMLNPSGFIFFEVPNCPREYWNGRPYDGPHLLFYTKKSFEVLAEKYDFKFLNFSNSAYTFSEDHRFQRESQDLYHKGKSSIITKLKQTLKKLLPKKLISFRQDILQIQKIRNDIKMNWFVNNTGDNCYIRGILQKK
jgi:SAM-dependent methyltransferase